MFDRETVLVLGAGASMPYDFPSGRGLLNLAVAQDSQDIQRYLEMGIDGAHVRQFVRALKHSGRQSIDAFLEGTRGEYDNIGKAMITALISEREDRNALFHRGKNESWYAYLFDELTSRGVERFGENRLRIVTFNYDRSLEFFLVDRKSVV